MALSEPAGSRSSTAPTQIYGPMAGPVVAIAIGGMAHKHSGRTGEDFPAGAVDLLTAQINAGDPACKAFVTLLARHGGSDDDPTTDLTMGGQRDA